MALVLNSVIPCLQGVALHHTAGHLSNLGRNIARRCNGKMKTGLLLRLFILKRYLNISIAIPLIRAQARNA